MTIADAAPKPARAPVADASEWLVVGRIAGAYGVKGWVRITSFTVPPGNIADYRPWRVGGRLIEAPQVQPHGNGCVAHFDGCDDRDAAAAFRGAEIEVPTAALPALEEDEFYWRDLLGMQVTNLAGETLGKVMALQPSGANDLLVVRDGEDERLVPFAAAVVRHVDKATGSIVVDWGLDY